MKKKVRNTDQVVSELINSLQVKVIGKVKELELELRNKEKK